MLQQVSARTVLAIVLHTLPTRDVEPTFGGFVVQAVEQRTRSQGNRHESNRGTVGSVADQASSIVVKAHQAPRTAALYAEDEAIMEDTLPVNIRPSADCARK